MQEIRIYPATPGQKDEIISMHKEIFDIAGDESISEIVKSIDIGFTLAAEDSGMLAGFASVLPYKHCPDSRENMSDMIRIAKTPFLKRFYKGMLDDNQKRFGGKIVAEYYGNEFAKSQISLTPKDFHCLTLAVGKNHRQKGTGTRLLEGIIDISKQHNASYFFTECWSNGNGESLYKSAGLQPIAHVGPVYPDASAVTIMGLRV